MIYDMPASHDPVDQGDSIDGCPVFRISQFSVDDHGLPASIVDLHPLRAFGSTC
jgi:hypothetical protein